ncbi:histidine phosphatase family protein [Gordonia terrae]
MTVNVVLIRHGLPNRVEGVTKPDPGLSPSGRDQADAVADALRHERLSVIASSDLRRARETAAPTVDASDRQPVVDPGVAELYNGEDYYIPIEEMAAAKDPRLDRWRELLASRESQPMFAAYREQVLTAMSGLIARTGPGGTLAVFCHGGTIGVCVEHALGARVDIGEPEYGSITRIKVDGEAWKLRSYNEIQHVNRLPPRERVAVARAPMTSTDQENEQ